MNIVSIVDAPPDPPLLAVLISTAALMLVLAVAVGTNVVFTRETRRRVELAVAAAGRIAAGDFSARLRTGGPEPLSPLGKAFDSMASRLEQADADKRQLLSDLAP
ncbi:MAG: HAMP domain-containing protein [Actinomycetota bacterium]|nr:HAMP domain-containing protein [Actinomycetota bacterium]